MPKYRIKAGVNWSWGDYDLGTYEFDSQEEADDAAWQMAVEQLDSSAELVTEDDEDY